MAALNIDADVIQADWLRIIARMRGLRLMHPELTDQELRVASERDHIASQSAG